MEDRPDAMAATPLLEPTGEGLYCAAGDFHVDPWRPVDRAVITHAHSDHASRGCGRYLTTKAGARVLRARMLPGAAIDEVEYGEAVDINGVRVELHPAGHILGSAQVRVKHLGEIWVISGDYKVEADATCAAFEAVRCHTFVSESTFALPIYRWEPQVETFARISEWWRFNREAGRASMLYGYALGKAQRMIAGVDPTIGPIITHGAVEAMTRGYRETGVALPPTTYASELPKGTDFRGALIVAPPSAHGTSWARRFAPLSTGFASGWMRIRGARRRRSVDRGFVLSDHADWPGLVAAIEATGASRVELTHGYSAVLARWLKDRGLETGTIATRYQGERDDSSEAEGEPSTEEPAS